MTGPGGLRRIDLLGLDKSGGLVVIELKRTEDGGHMESQAIRYAAMVSPMTFDQATEAHRKYLDSVGLDSNDPADAILEFLGKDEPFDFNCSVGVVVPRGIKTAADVFNLRTCYDSRVTPIVQARRKPEHP